MPNGPSDVANGAPNPENYTDNGDGTVTDNVTGLIWESPSPNGSFSLAAAVGHCTGLNLGGFTDWRLPSVIELFSLVDFSVTNPTINTTHFPGTTPGTYWSSTPSPLAGNQWIVTFSVGLMTPNHAIAGGIGSVRCVR
jgi:hypothetical protein